MPRTTNNQYLEAHGFLAALWAADNGVFGYLSPAEQWYLHDYFAPSRTLTELELLEHRRRISVERPNLPQSAGRALKQLKHHAKLKVAVTAKMPAGAGRASRKQRKIVVRGVVRPEIDSHKLARALLELARHMAGEGRVSQDEPPKH